MSAFPKLPSCPPWCRDNHERQTGTHIRNVDVVDGPPFSSVTVEVNVMADGDGEPYVRVGIHDEQAHLVSDDPFDSDSFHRIGMRTASAFGFAIVHLDPRGVREVGELLLEAVEVVEEARQ